MGIFDKVLDFLKPVGDVIDAVHTSDEEHMQAKMGLMEIQARTVKAALEYEQAIVASQASVVLAEAKSESWLTRNWRPLTMMVFMSLIVLHWFGVGPAELPPDLWTLLKLGIGGYVAGRSVEKTAAIVSEMKAPEVLG